MIIILLAAMAIYNLAYCIYAGSEGRKGNIYLGAFLSISCIALLALTLLLFSRGLSIY